MQKRVIILGATGSIGISATNCIRRFPEKFKIVGMSTYGNIELLEKLIKEFNPEAICIGNETKAEEEKRKFSHNLAVFNGDSGLEKLVNEMDFDILLNALVGAVGLRATVAALNKKKKVALANKESLVIGGEYINKILKEKGGELIPVDSEHSAIMQCLNGRDIKDVSSIILTASGGPFRILELEKYKNIKPQDALNHPTWNMGKKITIDCATLVNKGFEVIEAHYLFGISYDKLRVLIHPQSIVHSMVEFHDGAILAQMGIPDMELPIQYALSYPQRLPIAGKRLNLAQLEKLSFFEPDFKRFPCLKLTIDAGKTGGTMPVVLNAANEIAVDAFLNNKISFNMIGELIKIACDEHTPVFADSLEIIERIDLETRKKVLARIIN